MGAVAWSRHTGFWYRLRRNNHLLHAQAICFNSIEVPQNSWIVHIRLMLCGYRMAAVRVSSNSGIEAESLTALREERPGYVKCLSPHQATFTLSMTCDRLEMLICVAEEWLTTSYLRGRPSESIA